MPKKSFPRKEKGVSVREENSKAKGATYGQPSSRQRRTTSRLWLLRRLPTKCLSRMIVSKLGCVPTRRPRRAVMKWLQHSPRRTRRYSTSWWGKFSGERRTCQARPWLEPADLDMSPLPNLAIIRKTHLQPLSGNAIVDQDAAERRYYNLQMGTATIAQFKKTLDDHVDTLVAAGLPRPGEVNATRELGLTLEVSGQISVVAYTDASYGVHVDGKSHTGAAVPLCKESSTSAKQRIVTKSDFPIHLRWWYWAVISS